MIFHPRDRRRIGDTLRALGDQEALRTWETWVNMFMVNQPSTRAPYEIAALALRALLADESNIKRQLDADPDEDSWADLVNDLGYVQAIKEELLAENVGH